MGPYGHPYGYGGGSWMFFGHYYGHYNPYGYYYPSPLMAFLNIIIYLMILGVLICMCCCFYRRRNYQDESIVINDGYDNYHQVHELRSMSDEH
jgi:hypothetical protein